LKTAESIQAALTLTQEVVETNQEAFAAKKVQIAANREKIASNEQEIQEVSKRFSDLTEFDTKGEATVFLAVVSKNIPAKDKTAVMDLAHNAVNLAGYLIEVKGFADSSGKCCDEPETKHGPRPSSCRVLDSELQCAGQTYRGTRGHGRDCSGSVERDNTGTLKELAC